MSDEQQGSLKGRQVLLEPQDRVDVEMVGRLVEQQQIRFRHERFAQQGASPPASGQLADRAVGGERQPRDHQLRLLLEAPAIALFELMLQVPQPFERGVMRPRPLTPSAWPQRDGRRHQRAQLTQAHRHFLEHRAGAR